ncbi:hypothetical protein [Kutzneria kofuensis]|uniref:Uncharacterized protein n=1 Tax=Kutzneria kofuensis TaxID=103725 RepID=A0A7W9NDV9_9PSEU|nr:hypothetical protein [Kutzneria kofuensis]MBB5889025.1 hypothetical protein [Kutzneria kofuensis]
MPTIPAPRSTCDPLHAADTFIVSLHTVVHAPRQTARTRAVLRACRDGVDRFAPGIDAGARVIDTRNCRAVDGVLLLDNRLSAGETCIVEYEVSRPPADHWEQVLTTSAWDLVIQVRFHPAAAPARCLGYQETADRVIETPVALTGGQSAHIVTLDARPGVHGIRWEWHPGESRSRTLRM